MLTLYREGVGAAGVERRLEPISPSRVTSGNRPSLCDDWTVGRVPNRRPLPSTSRTGGAASSGPPSQRGLLVVVVEIELVRMRAETELFYLILHLVGDPLLYEVVGEDVAFGQKRMVLTERLKRLVE